MRASRTILHEGEATYPSYALQRLADPTLGQVTLWGNPTLWTERRRPLLAMFCSAKAPASIILQVHDLSQQWRSDELTVIGGFHSPVEQECLAVLLRGPAPVIVCPARSLDGMRLKREYKEAMAAGRLLLMSPFGEKVRRRTTVDTAFTRNRFVAALADTVLFAHAQPGSKTRGLAQEVLEWGKKVYTLDHPANGHLLALGVGLFVRESEQEEKPKRGEGNHVEVGCKREA